MSRRFFIPLTIPFFPRVRPFSRAVLQLALCASAVSGAAAPVFAQPSSDTAQQRAAATGASEVQADAPASVSAAGGTQTRTGDSAAAAMPDSASDVASDTLSQPQPDFGARQKSLDQRGAQNDYRYAVAQHDCYSGFFVNHCLNQARDKMRVVQAEIRREQMALDNEQRADHARRRDEQAALQRAKDEANAPQRAAQDASNEAAYNDKQKQHVLDQTQRDAEAPQRAANAQSYEQKEREHALDVARSDPDAPLAAPPGAAWQNDPAFQQQLREARRQGQQDAAQRQQKSEHYQQKQTDAAQHKADVEQRQKQAAEKAQQKQQEQEQQEQRQKQQQQQQDQ